MNEIFLHNTSAIVLSIEIICGLVSTIKIAYELVELININKHSFKNNTNTENVKPIRRNFLSNPFTIILLLAFIFISILTFYNSDFIFKFLSIIVFISITLITIVLGFIYNKLYKLHIFIKSSFKENQDKIDSFINENQDKIDRADVAGSLYLFNNL